MRMMMIVQCDTEAFNAAVKDSSAGAKMQRILEAQKPEAAYFTEIDGVRSAVLVVELASASQIPSFAEPWFLTFNAKLQMHPVMTPADLGAAGLEALGKAW